MPARLTSWLPPGLRRSLTLLLKLAWGLLVLGLIAAIGAVLLLADDDVVDEAEGPRLQLEAGTWSTAHGSMARQSWSEEKPAKALRIFLFGGSQAFGSPYVHRDQYATSRVMRWLDVPNRGGIATWLRIYLQHLLPQREVQVVNLAVPGAPISTVLELLPTVLEHGSPDLLLLLSGNNEGSIWDPEKILTGPAFDDYLAEVEDTYRGHLEKIIARSQAAKVPLWLLTVPTNLRDHLPTDRPAFEIPPALEVANAGDCAALEARLAGAGEDHAVAAFLRARCLDRSGQEAAALPLYEQARARDKVFQRVRPGLNALLRASADAEGVRVIDLDRTIRAAARDGIPGDDLFLDSCHMRLAGYRLMGLELARRWGALHDLPEAHRAALAALPVTVFTPEELSRLHLVKRLKWLRLKLLAVTGSADWINRGRFATNYRTADNAVNDFFTAVERLEQDLPGLESSAPTGPTAPE